MPCCPRCEKRLRRTKTEKGLFFVCPQCQGRAVSVAVLRRWLRQDQVNRLWRHATCHGKPGGAPCPVCQKPTVVVPVRVGKKGFLLDVCKRCQFIWFDGGEFDRMPKAVPPRDLRRELPEEVREQIALAEMRVDAERTREKDFNEEAPDDAWQWIPALLGMPVEIEASSIGWWPLETWGLIASMITIFLLSLPNLPKAVWEFGLIPAEAWRMGGLTLVTSFFLHADVFHLLGNAYFLLIFGDNVEDYLGRLRFFGLVAAAAFFGDLLHILSDPHSQIPCIGASGGISGVIVFYALQFPHARLGFLVRFWYVFRWFQMPAYFALICWVLLQLVLAHLQLAGLSNISALAHLGGAAVGLGAWVLWRKRPYR